MQEIKEIQLKASLDFLLVADLDGKPCLEISHINDFEVVEGRSSLSVYYYYQELMSGMHKRLYQHHIPSIPFSDVEPGKIYSGQFDVTVQEVTYDTYYDGAEYDTEVTYICQSFEKSSDRYGDVFVECNRSDAHYISPGNKDGEGFAFCNLPDGKILIDLRYQGVVSKRIMPLSAVARLFEMYFCDQITLPLYDDEKKQ